MLRKIVSVFLALATVVVLFTACDGDKTPTTTEPISTGNVSTTQPSTTKPEPKSYVLTTQVDKTVPWQETTRFETTAADINTITVPTDTIEVPPVNVTFKTVGDAAGKKANVIFKVTWNTKSNPDKNGKVRTYAQQAILPALCIEGEK